MQFKLEAGLNAHNEPVVILSLATDDNRGVRFIKELFSMPAVLAACVEADMLNGTEGENPMFGRNVVRDIQALPDSLEDMKKLQLHEHGGGETEFEGNTLAELNAWAGVQPRPTTREDALDGLARAKRGFDRIKHTLDPATRKRLEDQYRLGEMLAQLANTIA